MHKSILTIAFMLAVTPLLLAQKMVFDANAERLNLKNFHSIHASAGVEVMAMPGDVEGVAISVEPASIRQHVRVEVEDGVLKVGRKANLQSWMQNGKWKVKLYVSYTTLRSLEASSGALVKAEVKADVLSTQSSSGGMLELTGAANKLNADASSGGLTKAYSMQVQTASADASSGGGIYINVAKQLDAEASSGGFVRYKGNATSSRVHTSSGGMVKRSSDSL